MTTRYPRDFTPDLRRLKSWPSLEGSLWREPYLIELTYAENYSLIRDSIRGKRLNILDVGCGTGFASLELARAGHDVLGIDSKSEMISLARRTMMTDPHRKGRGDLRYETADFHQFDADPESYDAILFSRVLHDMPYPGQALSKARNLLRNNGRLICIEYAFDRLDRRTAIWLYQIRKSLEILGLYSSPNLPDDPKSGVDQIMKETLSGRKEHINRFEEMRRPLTRFFDQKKLTWHPYHFWQVVGDMRIPDRKREKSLAVLVRRMEEFLIAAREIEPVLFRFVGTKELSRR